MKPKTPKPTLDEVLSELDDFENQVAEKRKGDNGKGRDMWIHNDDPLECGVPMTRYAINLWRKPALIADWQAGETLRDLATKYDVSHETARKWTESLTRKEGAHRRPKRSRFGSRG